jgi:DNA-directed RNA polymerase specialized sigma24 family protein
MSADESVTCWIDRLKAGDRQAAQPLWERYYGRLAREARRWLKRAPAAPAADEEDIALGAFASFCRRAEEGRFPRLLDRNDLWQLLLVIAYRKACDQIKHEGRRQPRQGRAVHASALAAGPGDEAGLFADMIGQEPGPAMVAQTAEECRRLLAELGGEELRQVALWKLEGYTNEEIAPRMNGGEGRSLATVERKLKEIRLRWEKEVNR